MHQLAELIQERIASGLRRKSLTSCSRWAKSCRIMGPPFPGPWTFKYHPWLEEMHDSDAEFNVGQKSAQVGYTETVLNKTLFMIDVKGVDCLYVLPAKTPDATDFSSGRFNPALELSPYLSKLFSDVKNVGHKRAGATNLYIRGSRSRAGLKSIPTGFVILDEVDEMDQENLQLAHERASGQVEKQIWAVSTPTLPKYGINKFYLESSQEHYFFRCPHCNKYTELVFPDCIEITGEEVNDESIVNSYIKCKECKNKLIHETKFDWLANGKWIPSYTNRSSRGFHVNQLYSSTVKPVDFAKSYLRSLRNPTDEQEFHNSKLGLPHVVEGAGVTDADIENCKGNYKNGVTTYNQLITLGVDVGRWLHYEIDQWTIPGSASNDLNVQSRPKVIEFGKVLNFEELDLLMLKHRILSAVVDANPERRKAFEFATRHYGRVKLCFYGQGIQGKQIHIGKDEEPTITVDRTSWLDLSLGRFRNKAIDLPIDVNHEYRSHIKCPIRVYEKDRNGNPVGRYVSNDDDHYAHARNYAELALPFALSFGVTEDIKIL